MDTLSLIFDDMHMQGGVFAHIQLGSPWAIELRKPGQASFHIVTKGQGWLMLADHEPVQVQAGDLLILPGGPRHILQDALRSPAAERPIDILADVSVSSMVPVHAGGPQVSTTLISGHFCFDAIMAAPLMAAMPPLMHIRSFSTEPPLWLAIGLQFLSNEVSTQRPAQQAVINRLTDIMLIECMRDYVEALPPGSNNWLAALRDKAVSAALAEMHRRPQRSWTVQELAELACLSRSAFAERFAQMLGMPPLSYLTQHRMRLAARQLLASRTSIGSIAESVGYQSNNAFSQAFRREYGCTPSEFRERGAAALASSAIGASGGGAG